jgi:hypothetical protein
MRPKTNVVAPATTRAALRHTAARSTAAGTVKTIHVVPHFGADRIT